jgi:hypothetical protein
MTRGVLTVALVLASSPLAGQDPGRSRSPRRSHWITEASYLARLSPDGDIYSTRFPDFSASLELGGVRDLDSRFSVGAGLSADWVQGTIFSFRPRFRYRASPSSSLDLAPGLAIAGVPGPPRFTMNASYLWRDRLGVTVQTFVLESSTFQPNGTYFTRDRLVAYAGIRLGQTLGLVGATADAVALLTFIGLYALACGGNCD